MVGEKDEGVEGVMKRVTPPGDEFLEGHFFFIGRTLQGKRLKLVFQLKPGNAVRIITG